MLVQALDAARDALRERGPETEGGSAEPRPTNAEALAAVADSALAGGLAGRSGGERQQVVVHVDETALAGRGVGGCELAEGPALALETARRLACDSSLVRVRASGRAGRSRSDARRALDPTSLAQSAETARQRLPLPGVRDQRSVDAHHIRHWAHGGETALDNLVLLCRRHHRLVHEGGYSVERLPGKELRFRDPLGGPIPDAPLSPPGCLDALLKRNRPFAIDTRTYASGAGDRMDLDLTVQPP